MTTARPARDPGLSSLRAAAIVIVVCYHAVLDAPPDASPIYDEFLVTIRYMALEIFTAVSGYLYGARPVTRACITGSLRDKARRLLLPLATMTTALLVLRALMPGVNNVPDLSDVAEAYLFRFEHLWYLQSLFLIFVVMSVCDGFGLLPSPTRWACILSGWFAVSLVVPLNSFFGYAGLIQLMPFFLAGYGLRRWPELLQIPRLIPGSWLVLAVGLVLLHLDHWGLFPLSDIVVEKWGFLNFFAGLALIVLAIRYRGALPNLGGLGESTFAVYLFHTVGMAVANRVTAATPWDDGYNAVVLWKIFLGIALPLVLERAIRKSATLSTLFLGDPWKSPFQSFARWKREPAGQGEGV